MDPRQAACARCAQLIYDGFNRYNRQFKRITDRARRRFEQRDWVGQIQDISERVELYDKWVHRIRLRLRRELDDKQRSHEFWEEIRSYYGSRLENVPDAGFMKTFFNSISRRIFGTIGTNPRLEFIQPAPDEGLPYLAKRRYPCWGDLEATFRKVLDDYRFRIPYLDRDRDAAVIADDLRDFARRHGIDADAFLRFEFIDSHFYQGARAYLVGRSIHPSRSAPIVVALENTGAGIRVDATLMEESEVGIVFSYTRSYYFADPSSVVAAVGFLHSILPAKPIDELYTVLGRLRQGKTERFRAFSEHLGRSDDQFVHTEGDRGLVMMVFTLPSFNLVFKVIRDHFGYPKNTTRQSVMGKYRLVSRHDHAGRLIDTQEFRNLELPADRFEENLLTELTTGAAESVRREDDKLIFNHVYIERRVRPLNLYIREAERDDAQAAILDYGQAIKDLAETNIFPGDLLLKNFGVTASGRVVFYDYDEVALVTDCRFRDLPQTGGEFDLMDPGMTSYIGDNDIFPEEFIKFLAMDAELRTLFLRVHGDLLTAAWWRAIRHRRLEGRITQVVPYTRPRMGSESNFRATAAATGSPVPPPGVPARKMDPDPN